MLTLTLKDGTHFAYVEALETEEWYNGASRRTLTVTALPDAAKLDELAAKLTEENLAAIRMTCDEPPADNLYEGYVLVLSLGLQQVQTQPETPESPAVYEPRLVVKLGRRTYIEQQLARLGLL